MMARRSLLLGAASLALTGTAGLTRALAAPHVAPSSAGKSDPYRAIFDEWTAKHRPQTLILTVRRKGKTLFDGGYQTDADRPTLIASLSKAITGAAIATLVRDGKLAFDTPMREALPSFFEVYGRPFDRRLEHVTVEQLLVHRSGLIGASEGDPIHQIRQKQADAGNGYLSAPQPLIAEHFRTTPLIRDPGGKASYSNTGYHTLTAIVEECAGRPYEVYCRETVFAPLNIASPRLSPDWAMFSGSGGWTITGADYLSFLEVFDPAHSLLGEVAKNWIALMQRRWETDNRRDRYSLGVNTARNGPAWDVWHNGGLNWRGRDLRGRPIRAVIESIGQRRADGTATFFALTPAVPGGHSALAELQQQIKQAHDSVTV